METFLKIKDRPNYSISNMGNVRNDKTGRILKQHTKENGYKVVMLGRKTAPLYVHRLVALAFVENVLNKPQVNHKDGNKENNNTENLEWVTASENSFAYGYKERIEHRKKKIIAKSQSGDMIEFNSRDETAAYFKCNKSCLQYGKLYKKGNKKGWTFELKI